MGPKTHVKNVLDDMGHQGPAARGKGGNFKLKPNFMKF